ncbi:MAG: type I-F CRISPR-associated protein Csy2 [Desulfotalea sp.]|nr:MAG: type I-F CRISPR-associated protein Csy2 [Desulfotalea sp.]
MEDGLLVLRHLQVENANAISGMTWGFPAISNFLGFVHAVTRQLPKEWKVELVGCGVVCHGREVQAYQPRGWGDYVFALTRNPLTKKAELPSFVEEGRMHMTVSLLIPFKGPLDVLQESIEVEDAEEYIKKMILHKRLAGGTITHVDEVKLHAFPKDSEGRKIFTQNTIRTLLPGRALVQRSAILAEHLRVCRGRDETAEAVDAWLDFVALKYQVVQAKAGGSRNSKVQWNPVAKPGQGCLVPINIGYRGISDLYQPGVVDRTRDGVTPFRFVESVYSVGEWISPHRAKSIDQLIWRYCVEQDTGWYLCKNTF